MPVVQVSSGAALDMRTLDISELADGDLVPDGPGHAVVYLNDWQTVDFYGVGLAVSDDRVTGGTITGIGFNEGPKTTWQITGISVSAVAFANWALSGQSATAWQTIFSGADTLRSGSASGNYLMGYGGNDDMYAGGAGHDTLVGGAGDDLYGVFTATDSVIEAPGQGSDLINAWVDYTLPSNVERLLLRDTAVTGRGNELDNRLTGNDVANALYGLAGNDTLVGKGGDDTLDGGAGNDRFESMAGRDIAYGGIGDDVYYVGSAVNRVVENPNEGSETVWTSVDYALPDNVEWLNSSNTTTGLTLTSNAHGGGLVGGLIAADTLIGLAGADVLYGLGGNDTLRGGGGDDTFFAGGGNDQTYGEDGDDAFMAETGQDRFDGGTGFDTVTFKQAFSTYTTSIVDGELVVQGAEGRFTLVNVEKMVFADAVTLPSYFFDQTITGTARADSLKGNFGNDVIWGRGGNDTLNGDAGADKLYGEAGNDKLLGGLGDDTLTGGAGADTLNGGAGQDQLEGGAGADLFAFSSIGDSRPGAPDRIRDLSAQDRIDLRAIDANPSVAGNQAFALISSSVAFSQPGQMHLTYDGTNTRLELNTDTDAASEMTILIAGNHTSATGWFL